MAGKTRMSVLKRQRELQKAERAALKREQRQRPKEAPGADAVATREDLEGYGVVVERTDDARPR